MHWLLALVGSLLGLMVGSVHEAFLGLVGGALIGWQWARIRVLGRQMDELESRLRVLHSVQVARQASAATPSPASEAAPASTKPTDAMDSAPSQVTASAHSSVSANAPSPMPSDADSSEPVAAIATARAAPSSAAPEPQTAVPPQLDGAVKSAPGVVAREYFQDTVHSQPSALERGIQRLREWFFSGNVPVKIGMLVLLFGVAAALKYSIDAGLVTLPLPLRLALVAAGGLFTVHWGWRNRTIRPAFGLSLQGGGIGILLLTTFAAYRLYALLPAGIAFALVLLLVAGAAMLAVLQNAAALAVLGFLGGYLAPVLLSTGSGSHVALFSYYAVLNLAVFAIAWVRHWRALNLIGFAFTFLIGMGWGARYYRPEHFATVEPFLILFFLFYVAIVVLHALRAPERLRGLVDGPILFGTPLLAFGMQAAMLRDQPMALAWSALAVALLYLALAVWLIRVRRMLLLGQSFAALAAGFGTLAVPLAFSSRWTSTTWALEGVALVWLGLRQRRVLPQVSGLLLQLLAAGAYVASAFDDGWRGAGGEWPLLNGHALGVLVLAVSAFSISRLYERAGGGRLAVWPGFLLGTAWWLLAGLREIDRHARHLHALGEGWSHALAWIIFAAITLLVMGALRHLARWPRLGWNVILALASSLMLAVYLRQAEQALQWPSGVFWAGWALAALFGLAALRTPRQRGLGLGHVTFLTTLALVYGRSLADLAQHAALGGDWVFALGVVPLIALVALTWRLPALGAFPLAREFPGHARIWFALAGVALLMIWTQSLLLGGDTAPLPFVPLLNPAELLQVGGLIAATAWLRRQQPDLAPALAACATFVALSLAGLRAVHQYSGLPWDVGILEHGVAQTTLTVLWSILGVAAWVLGSRRQRWGLWLTGAIGMGLVLLKLVLVDRQYVGNIAGIVSFMAVGLLLVMVGRIAPTPPRQGARREVEQ